MMAPTAPVHVLALLGAVAAFALYVSAYAFAQRRVRCAREFSLFILSVAIYALGYAWELTNRELPGIYLALRLEYLGVAWIPVTWVLFARRFARDRRESPTLVLALAIIPILTIAMVFTSPGHSLYYVNARVRTDGPFAVFAFDRGPFYWLWAAYLQLCIAWGSVVMIREAFGPSRIRRNQAITVALAGLIPWLAFIGHLLDIWPWGLDSGPFSGGIAGFFFALAIFRLGFFELVPKARDQALEALHDGFLVLDRKGLFLDANPAARDYLGLGSLSIGAPLVLAEPLAATLRGLLEAGEGTAEAVLPLATPLPVRGLEAPLKDACVEDIPLPACGRHLSLMASRVLDGRGKPAGTSLVIRDVTELSALLARLRDLAATDTLTGLMNRRSFFEVAQRDIEVARRTGRRFVVGIADIDHFKLVNDTYGHAAGDQALKTAAGRFLSCLRSTDLVCRYGGEEFAFLFPECELEAGRRTAERLREALASSPVVTDLGDIALSASFGLCASPVLPGEDLDSLLKRADAALYLAKDRGRNQVCVSS